MNGPNWLALATLATAILFILAALTGAFAGPSGTPCHRHGVHTHCHR